MAFSLARRQEPGIIDAELDVRTQAPVDAELERERVARDRRPGDRERGETPLVARCSSGVSTFNTPTT
jgi:hypothetical protein